MSTLAHIKTHSFVIMYYAPRYSCTIQ